jgi:hypothetical protein
MGLVGKKIDGDNTEVRKGTLRSPDKGLGENMRLECAPLIRHSEPPLSVRRALSPWRR